MDCDLLRKYHPSTFCTTFPKHGPRALKRKPTFVDGKDLLLYQNHSSCKRAAWTVTPKNALVQLNELRPGLRYEILSKTGPLHAPVFSVGVEVNGFHFEGCGPTKKQAKMRAAELALRSFIQFPNASQAHAIMGNFTGTPTDFTADKQRQINYTSRNSDRRLVRKSEKLISMFLFFSQNNSKCFPGKWM